ncbi:MULTISPECIES: hypothetical protein [unclassified Mycobacterium]|uniref:hypothetical protein n=1 Tax=unclassified Mycobacterium TaxID=2642494 RepID=UPI0029C71DD1|nr:MULTISPECIES: hypothetical protein [unclassified Mycobacterium]
MKNDQTTSTPTDTEAWLDSLDVDPAKARDGRHMRRIAAAAAALGDAMHVAGERQAELDAAVAAAREAGDSWAMIGMALGISRQGAYQRFGKVAP